MPPMLPSGVKMIKILVAEDEIHIRNLVSKHLRNEGYSVIEAADGQQAYQMFSNEHIDLVVTDIMMPNIDGNELVARIREVNRDVPILMLTALETIDDKQTGFNSGTDDYLVKSGSMKELVMRVKALLRRYKVASENKIELKNTTLFFDTNTVKINGKEVLLTKKLFLLLFKLLSYPNKIFTREQLMNEIWGFDSASDDRTVDTHIKWLRDKVDSNDFDIVTVRGLGYKAVVK